MKRALQTTILPACFAFSFLFSLPAYSDSLIGSWEGSYECSNTLSPIALEVVDEFNARLDFYESADDKTVKASQWVEIWHRDKEFLLIGSEWIVKPNGWALSTLKMTQQDEQSLEGTYEHRSCGAATFKKSTSLAAKRDAEIKAQQLIPDESFNLIANYTCSGRVTGSYWQITKNDDQSYQLNVTSRDHTSAHSAKLYSIDTRKSGAGLQGMESRGSFGVQLEFLEGSDSPSGYWTTRSGLKDENCEEIQFQVANAPTEYWDSFFEAVKNPEPGIDDVEAVTAQYRTLPDTQSLSVADPKSYQSERNRLWKEFTENYIKALPDKINALALGTPDERKEARVQIARMENPGFRMNVDIPTMYSSALFANDVPIEPLYFTDEKAACERASAHTAYNSQLGIETFVGFSGYDWTDTSGEEFISFLEACSSKNELDSAVASTAIKTIQQNMPRIMKKAEAARTLREAATEAASKPRSLTTLVETKGYSLLPQGIYGIDEATINRLYTSSLIPLREEAMVNAENELNTLFEQADSSTSGEITYNSCINSLGNPYGLRPEYLAPLYDICDDKGKQHLIGYLENETTRFDQIEIDEKNVHDFVNARPSRRLEGFVSATGLDSEYKKFNSSVAQLIVRANDSYLSILDGYFDENSEEADEKLRNGCSKYPFNQRVSATCSTLTEQAKQRRADQRCDHAIEVSQLSKKLSDDNVLYGDGVEQRNISFRDLICQASQKGVNLMIAKEAKTLELHGMDAKSNQKLFDASMVRAENDSKSWTVDSIGGAVANTKFGNVNQGQLVQCLVSRWGC